MSEEFELGAGDEIIGLRELARLVGVDLRAVQKAIDAGRLDSSAVAETKAGRKVYREKALKQWQATRVPGQNNRFGELSGDAVDDVASDSDEDGTPAGSGDRRKKGDWFLVQAEEKAKLLEAQRKTAEIELARLQGRMHDEDDISRIWSDIVLACRQRILAIPTKAASEIAAVTKSKEIAKIQKILERLCREALSELARYDEAEVTEEEDDS